MAENDEGSSLRSYEIERSIQQVLDTQEDEEDTNSEWVNLFFNEGNSGSYWKKFWDNTSDYADKRSQIENIDNKSLNSHPDHYISLVQDESSLDDIDKTGNYFIPFLEQDCKGLQQKDVEANGPKAVSSLIISEFLNDDGFGAGWLKEGGDRAESHGWLTIKTKKTDKLTSLFEMLKEITRGKLSVNIRITCEKDQFGWEELRPLLGDLRNIRKLQVVNQITMEPQFECTQESSNFEDAKISEEDIRIDSSWAYSSSHHKIGGKGHQKCRSMYEWKGTIGWLTEEDPYKDANSASKKTSATNESGGSHNTHKFTWRYEIQIENDKEFQVARKLIGSKGWNMKRIIEQCHKLSKTIEDASLVKYKIQDTVKLRLRGRGSGFKEGPRSEESNDPLHLWISSKYSEIYEKAWELTEGLLDSIYDQYLKFAQKKNPGAKRLVFKKLESAHMRK